MKTSHTIEKTRKPSVAIIIVNWNGEKWLTKLLDSISTQTYNNLKTYLVDNGSIDNSVKFIEENYDDTVVIKSKENLGFADGNNLGIDSSNEDLLLLLNNDTWIENDFVEKLIEYYISSGHDVVAPYEAGYAKEIKSNYITTIDLLGHPVYKYGNFNQSKNFYLSGACLLVSRKLYEDSGGLDNNFFMYFEEIDWFWRLNMMGKRISYAKNIHVYHAGSGSTGKGIRYKSFLWRNENTLQMLIKNYSLITLILIIPFYLLQNVIEILAFTLTGKTDISKSYFNGLIFNIKHIRRTLKNRKYTQSLRTVNDIGNIKRMFKGPGKIVHLIQFFKH